MITTKPFKKHPTKLELLLLSILILIVGFIGGMAFGENYAASEILKQEEATKQEKLAQQQADGSKAYAQYLNKISYFHTSHFIMPTAGEILCLGQYYPITWELPSDMDGATLYINSHIMGTFPNGYGGDGKAKSTFLWRAGYNRDSVPLTPGTNYQIRVAGIYAQSEVSYLSEKFSLSTCNP